MKDLSKKPEGRWGEARFLCVILRQDGSGKYLH